MVFKIVTWNINGMRSFGGIPAWRKIFTDFDADLLCFQETKINRSAVEEWMAFVPDYSSYFTFPKGTQQFAGYAGVATFCRESTQCRPSGAEMTLVLDTDEVFVKNVKKFEFDLLDEECTFATRWPKVHDEQSRIGLPAASLGPNMWKLVDSEGRCVLTKHQFVIEGEETPKSLFVFNVYCPRNDSTRPERKHHQLRFYHMLQKRAFQLLSASSDNFVIIVGDYNTTHCPIDVYSDEDWCYANSYSRQWLSELLAKKTQPDGCPYFYDAFRHLNPNEQKSFTCWNSKLNCRATNYGSRLDYILIDHKLLPHLIKCYPLTDYQGSDHCPVVAEFDERIQFTKPDQHSAHCTKLWPEFGAGASQKSIKQFFSYGDRAQVIAQMQQQSPTKRPIPNVNSISPNKRQKKDLPSKKLSQIAQSLAGQTSMKSYFQSLKPNASEKSDITQSGPCSSTSNVEAVVEQDVILEENSNSRQSSSNSQKSQSAQWKALFRQEPPPLCTGHRLPCIKRKVKTPGPRQGREFYACPKSSVGPAGHPETRCKYFRWVTAMNKFAKGYKPLQAQTNGQEISQDAESLFEDEDIDKLLSEFL